MDNTYTKTQKLIKVGNSLATTLDPQFLRQAGIKAGDSLSLHYAADGAYATLIPAKTVNKMEKMKVNKAEREAVLMSKVTPEFQTWVEKSLEEDAEALKKLANL